MTEYRVYLLDTNDKIASACWVEAPTLRKAVAEVSQSFGFKCEIWDGANRLAVVNSGEAESTASAGLAAGHLEVSRIEHLRSAL